MMTLFGAVLVASLLGSMHCVGMCGPLAILASSPSTSSTLRKTDRQQVWLSRSLYHLARFLSYSLAGVAAGSVGAALQHTGDWLGWQQTAARLSGGIMALIGLLMVVRLLGGQSMHFSLPIPLQRQLGTWHALARRQSLPVRATAIGALTVFLPCGWLYAFMITAAGTASPWLGATVMALFWVGTVPSLALFQWGFSSLTAQWRLAMPWVSAILLVSVGFYTMTLRASTEYTSLHETAVGVDPVPTVENQIQRVQSLPSKKMPCCIERDAKDRDLSAKVEAEVIEAGNAGPSQSIEAP